MRINPDIPEHQQLETEVIKFLHDHGFIIDNATYHEKMKPEIVKRLQFLDVPTALYVRGRADRLAVHHTRNIIFEWEAKTHVSKSRNDWTMEALPICHHIAKIPFHVHCLYIYRNTNLDHEHNVGFWISQIPPIKVVLIPEIWQGQQLDYFRTIFGKYLPAGTKIVSSVRNVRGSKDPFLIIDELVVKTLPHWKNLIIDMLCEEDDEYER